MIIVEGPDLIGKTTLVKSLSEYYQLPNTIELFRFENRKEYKNYIDIAEKIDYQWFKCFKNVDFIGDRGLLSPIIYSQLRNKPNCITMDKILEEFPNVLFIILYGNLNYILKNHKKGDILYSNKILGKIYNLYRRFILKYEKEHNLNIINIEYKSKDVIFEEARDIIRKSDIDWRYKYEKG